MLAFEWIKQAQKAGWLVTGPTGLVLSLQCSKQGCRNTIKVPLDNLGPPPEPCPKAHDSQYSRLAFNEYASVVKELQRRRRSLGLSQDDVCAASGLAEGHINKLENFDRMAQFATLQLWAQTLGLKICLQTAELPAATARMIEARLASPYREDQARFKQDRIMRLPHG